MAGVASLLDQSRKNGPMRATPLALVADIPGAVVETTVDFMISDPAIADAYAHAHATAF